MDSAARAASPATGGNRAPAAAAERPAPAGRPDARDRRERRRRRAGSRGAGGAAAGSGGRGGAAGSQGAAGSGAGGAAAYNPCPSNGDPCKVLPLGDSITFGINYEGSYRVELFKRAVTAGQKITFVGTQTNGPAMAPGTTVPFPKNHEGWSGYTISMILAKAANDVQYGPHIILLHAGTNDTYMTDPSGAPMRLSSAVDSLASMFPNALIVVAKIIPYPSQTANVNLINQSIPAMVQSKQAAGKHVISVDLNTGFDTKTMLSSDRFTRIRPATTGWATPGTRWSAPCSRSERTWSPLAPGGRV